MSTIKEHVRILRSDQTLLSGNEPTFPIPDHAETHEISGGDEIEHDKIDGSGTNTHSQIDSFMTSHAARHKLGGADPIDLTELNDVTTTLLTDHDFLYWETASGLWKNKALVAGDANLSDLGVQGFVDLTESTIGYNDSTYTFTITDAGSGWSYWRDGVKHTISGNKSVVLSGTPPAADTYYIYIDATDGTLTASTSIWTLVDTKVLVAILEWNSASTPKYFLADERHQSFFPQRAHWHHHFTEGTELKSGGALSGYTVAPAVPADTDNTFGISAAEIVDEDLLHTLGALADPGGSGTDYLAYYRTGSATWAWEQSPVPFRYTAAGYIQYDNAGTMTQGQNAKFYNWYLCYTNYEGQPRHLLIPGNSEFGSALAAYAEGISDLDLSGFEPQELIFAYQLTFQTSAAYTTKGKCRLTRAPEPINAARIVASTSGGSIDHNTLAGLQGGNGTDEFYHLSALRYGFITDTQILAPNGAVGTPSYSFASDPDTGFYCVDSGIIRVSCNNSNTAYFSAGTLTLQSGINLSLASGGDIVSTNNGDIDIIPNGTGITKIGTGTPGHLTPTSGELYVQGKAEFDGSVYTDGDIQVYGGITVKGGNFVIQDNIPLRFGTSSDASIEYSTTETPDTLLVCTSADSNGIVFCEIGDRLYDFAHPQQTNPTLYIQSANQSATEWLSLTHDQINGLISAGTGLKLTSGNNGDITLDPNGTGITKIGAGTPGHLTPTSGEFYVPGKAEFDATVFVDADVVATTPLNTGKAFNGTASATGAYTNYGGYFTAQGDSGQGVCGIANATGAVTNYGVYGTSAGDTGRGVFGQMTGNTGAGVYGEATVTGAYANYGGYFTAAGNSGVAVTGIATATGTANNYGGSFEARGEEGVGVKGFATKTGAYTNYGGYFESTGDTGYGLYATAEAGGYSGYFDGGSFTVVADANKDITLNSSGTGEIKTNTDITSTASATFNISSASNQNLRFDGVGTGNINMFNNGNQTFQLLTSGIHKFYYPSAINVYESSGQDIVTGTYTTILFDNEVFDVQGEIDTGVGTKDGLFVATENGYYVASAGLAFVGTAAWAAGDSIRVQLSKNGATASDGSVWRSIVECQYGWTGVMSANVSAVVYLAAADTLEVQAWHDRGSNTALNGTGRANFFTVIKVA